MEYESACPPSPSRTHGSGGPRAHMAARLEEQLLSYSENAENEGGDEEYLEEEVLQVRDGSGGFQKSFEGCPSWATVETAIRTLGP